MSEPGFYDDLPEADYHADRTSLSQSGAKLLLKSPALFRYEQEHPRTSDAFDFGSAAHAVALGQSLDSVYVAPFDDWLKRKGPVGGCAYTTDEKRIAQEDGLAPLLPEQWLKVCDMAEVLAEHDLAMQLLTGGHSEVSAYAVDDATGVMRRCRFDYLHDDLGVDYKTSFTSDPREFGRSAANFGYHQQDAWYRDVAYDLGYPLRGFLFVVQMKEPPYLVSVCELTPDAVQRGRDLNQRALEMFRDCTDSDIWPGWGDDIHPIDLPAWAYYDKDAS